MDENGRRVELQNFNPNNYIVAPANYGIERSIAVGEYLRNLYQGPSTGDGDLELTKVGAFGGMFPRGGAEDLQRTYMARDGSLVANGVFVQQFVDAASFHYGATAAVAGVPLKTIVIGGGVENGGTAFARAIVNGVTGSGFQSHMDTSGAAGNPLRNVTNMTDGYNYIQNGTTFGDVPRRIGISDPASDDGPQATPQGGGIAPFTIDDFFRGGGFVHGSNDGGGVKSSVSYGGRLGDYPTGPNGSRGGLGTPAALGGYFTAAQQNPTVAMATDSPRPANQATQPSWLGPNALGSPSSKWVAPEIPGLGGAGNSIGNSLSGPWVPADYSGISPGSSPDLGADPWVLPGNGILSGIRLGTGAGADPAAVSPWDQAVRQAWAKRMRDNAGG